MKLSIKLSIKISVGKSSFNFSSLSFIDLLSKTFGFAVE